MIVFPLFHTKNTPGGSRGCFVIIYLKTSSFAGGDVRLGWLANKAAFMT